MSLKENAKLTKLIHFLVYRRLEVLVAFDSYLVNDFFGMAVVDFLSSCVFDFLPLFDALFCRNNGILSPNETMI